MSPTMCCMYHVLMPVNIHSNMNVLTSLVMRETSA